MMAPVPPPVSPKVTVIAEAAAKEFATNRYVISPELRLSALVILVHPSPCESVKVPAATKADSRTQTYNKSFNAGVNEPEAYVLALTVEGVFIKWVITDAILK